MRDESYKVLELECKYCKAVLRPTKAGRFVCLGCRKQYRSTDRIFDYSNYYLTKEEYDDILITQDYCCAICGDVDSNKNLAVDHDHRTGKIRGLLCQLCNGGLGMFRDDSVLLEKAIVYLNNRYDAQYQDQLKDNDDENRITILLNNGSNVSELTLEQFIEILRALDKI